MPENTNQSQAQAQAEHDTEIEITDVIFRQYPNGEVLAVFPYVMHVDPSTHAYLVSCYQHIGQHGSGDWSIIQRTTQPVPQKFQGACDLVQELFSIGYNLRVMRRISAPKWDNAMREAREYAYL